MKYDHSVSRHVASHPRTRTHHKARALPGEQPQGHTSHTHPINSVCPPALLPQKDALWWRKRGARGGGGGGGFKSNKRGQIEHLSKITPSPQRLTIKQCFSQLFLYPFIKHWTCLNPWEIVVYIFFSPGALSRLRLQMPIFSRDHDDMLLWRYIMRSLKTNPGHHLLDAP